MDSKVFDSVKNSYLRTRSVRLTADECRLSVVKTRRILITLKLWESDTSKQVGELYEMGISPMEISRQLNRGLKDIQNYLPYSRGSYEDIWTADSKKCLKYRNNKMDALVAIKKRKEAESKPCELLPVTGVYDYPKLTPIIDENQLSLSNQGLQTSFISDEHNKKPLTLILKGEKSVRITVPGELSLRQLSYLIRDKFKMDPQVSHRFEANSDVIKYLKNMGKSGAIIKPAETFLYDENFDLDYDGTVSIKSWYKSKYRNEDSYFAATDCFLYHKTEMAAEGPNKLLERLSLGEVLISHNCEFDCKKALNSVLYNIKIAENRMEESSRKGELSTLKSAVSELKKLRRCICAVEHDNYNREQSAYSKEAILTEYKRREALILQNYAEHLKYFNPRISPFSDTIEFICGEKRVEIKSI